MRFRTEKRTDTVGVYNKAVNKGADISRQSLRLFHPRGLSTVLLAEKS